MDGVLVDIRRYLKRTAMPVTVFGRQAVNDPRLVGDLANGRTPRPHTVARIQAFMRANPDGRR